MQGLIPPSAEADEPSEPRHNENRPENNPLASNELSDDEDEEEDSPLLNDLAEPTDIGQEMSTENDDQEIRVSVDRNGNLVAVGSQLADYQQRGEELNGTSPVLIGPGILRHDKKELHEKCCRLMLIFFKPWCHAQDLKKEYLSCEDAFGCSIKPVRNQFSSKWRICKFFMSAAIAGMIILPSLGGVPNLASLHPPTSPIFFDSIPLKF
ncbi:hypothetical protein DFH08DRAFT_820291 [Mycena albidolilacea]|uniref:Uncharacterized protein n=1 Tax=Mycena albidolilacea TaxID=1033008 RepID=A0AAD6ZDA0_9AGAR|nr:hypothetical protein DFH08DRAFT_820291 [Mycena albidolilacea]